MLTIAVGRFAVFIGAPINNTDNIHVAEPRANVSPTAHNKLSVVRFGPAWPRQLLKQFMPIPFCQILASTRCSAEHPS